MTDRRDLVNVQLKVHKSFKSTKSYPGNPRDYNVVLFGPVGEPNPIDTENPKSCMPSVFDEWMKDIWVPRNAAIFFKFGVIRHETSEVIEKEYIEGHRAFIGESPVIIECEYNEQEMVTVQVHDRMVGGPCYNTLTMIPDLPQLPETLGDFRMETKENVMDFIQDQTECQSDKGSAPVNEIGCPTEMPDATLPAVNSFFVTSYEKGRSFLNGMSKHIVPVGLLAAACGLAVFTYMKLKK